MRYTRRLSISIFFLAAILPSAAFPGQQAVSATSKQYAEAERAIQSNDFAGAERAYRSILSQDARQTAAWTGLGVLQYGQGNLRDAADSLQHSLQIDSSDAIAARAKLFLGLAKSDLGQYDQATPLLQASFATAPHGKLQRLAGFALLNCVIASADPEAGLVTISKLRTLYPDDPDVLYRSAELYTRLWTQAATELIAKHPDSYRVHQLAGEVYEAQGKTDQAIREYKAALEENSRLPQMHYRLGQLYLREGGANIDQIAMGEFNAELATDPQSAVTLFAMGEIERHEQKLDAAAEHYRAAIKLDPKIVDAQVGLAQILLAQKQIEPAIVQLQAAIGKEPENIQAHYVLMLAYRAQGNLAQAGVESATFKKLQAQKSENFQSRMDALLGAKVPRVDTISR